MASDLQDRLISFSRKIICLCRKIKFNPISSRIIDQMVRSGTSIGANYMEAVNGSSKKDFRNKIFICKKESQETKYWLDLLKESEKEYDAEIDILFKECHELNLIFQKSIQTLDNNMKIDRKAK